MLAMGLKCFKYIYNLKEVSLWPSLQRRQTIPTQLKSRHADSNRKSKVGLGFVEAVSVLLTGGAAFGRDGESFSFAYEGNRGGRRVVEARTEQSTRIWGDANSMKAPALLALGEAMLRGDSHFEETRGRWQTLLTTLKSEIGNAPPYDDVNLQVAAACTACKEAMMGLSDALYFEIKAFHESGACCFGDDAAEHPNAGLDSIVRPSPAPAPTGPAPGTLRATLGALIATGGTALLTGPTGTFKTTTATRAAVDADAALVVIKGRPGLDDRDFYGGITPASNGPSWVDGPVTRAFRQAQQGPVVLLIDELLRFEPLYLGALVGLLDAASPAELAARGIEVAEEGDHYVAELPNGDRVAAPTERLTLVATTNMGADYVQSVRLDAALMGRFELIVEVDRADPAVKDRLYREAAGDKGAELLHAIEAYVGKNQMEEGGLLVRRSHPRLMLNMARHLERLLQAGCAYVEAAVQAADMAVVSYCADRGSDGRLDASGRQLILDEVERLAPQAA